MPFAHTNQGPSKLWLSSLSQVKNNPIVDGNKVVTLLLQTSERNFLIVIGLDLQAHYTRVEWKYGDSDEERQRARDDFAHMISHIY